MKKIIIFIFINIIFSNIIYSQDAAVNFQDIYNKMKEKYSSIYPKKFEAYINGKIVEKQIATIPAKSYTSSKENIKLKFTFEQGAKPTLILENVDSFYRNMFSVFEGALETTGFYAIVGNSSTYSSFSQKFDLESVEENKNELYVEKQVNPKIQLQVTELLHNLGVPSQIKGYQYLREGILMLYESTGLIGGITKEVYPEIALRYNTTPSRVERAIRHAIEVSWNRADYEMMNKIFGHSIDYDRAKPTNSEFMVTLSDALRLNQVAFN